MQLGQANQQEKKWFVLIPDATAKRASPTVEIWGKGDQALQAQGTMRLGIWAGPTTMGG